MVAWEQQVTPLRYKVLTAALGFPETYEAQRQYHKTPEERDLRARMLSHSSLELTSEEDTAAIIKVPQLNTLCTREKYFAPPPPPALVVSAQLPLIVGFLLHLE